MKRVVTGLVTAALATAIVVYLKPLFFVAVAYRGGPDSGRGVRRPGAADRRLAEVPLGALVGRWLSWRLPTPSGTRSPPCGPGSLASTSGSLAATVVLAMAVAIGLGGRAEVRDRLAASALFSFGALWLGLFLVAAIQLHRLDFGVSALGSGRSRAGRYRRLLRWADVRSPAPGPHHQSEEDDRGRRERPGRKRRRRRRGVPDLARPGRLRARRSVCRACLRRRGSGRRPGRVPAEACGPGQGHQPTAARARRPSRPAGQRDAGNAADVPRCRHWSLRAGGPGRLT